MRDRPKKPRRKFVLFEVETTLTNAELWKRTYFAVRWGDCRVLQIHVNAAKKEPRK